MLEPNKSGHADENTILEGGFSDLLSASAEPEPLLQLMEELLADLKTAEPRAEFEPAPSEDEPAPPVARESGSSLLSLAGIVEALGDVAVAPDAAAGLGSPEPSENSGSEPEFPPEFEYKATESTAKPEPRALTLDSDEEPPVPLLPGFAGKPSALSGMFEALLESADSASEPEPETAPAAPPPMLGPPESTELQVLIESMEQEVILRAPASASSAPEVEKAAESMPEKAETRESCIVFGLGGTRYAVPMSNVTEIDTLPRVTPVPHTPDFVRGVTNRRGEVVCVLDLRVLLGLEPAAAQPRQRILVMKTRNEHIAAMVVDEVRGTTGLPLNSLPGPLGPVNDRVAELLAGVSQHQEQILNVLDVEKLFAIEEMRQLTGSGEASR